MPDDTVTPSVTSAEVTSATEVSTTTSEVQTQDVQTSAASGTQEQPNKGEEQKPKSLLEVVQDVVKPKAAEATTAETKVEAQPGQEQHAEQPKQGDDQPTGEGEDANLPFNKHPRFQQLIRERSEFKKDSDQLRGIHHFMAENRLSPEEVDQGFVIMAALKNDPLKARELLANTIKQLDVIAGEVLPQELETRVTAGELDREDAKRLVRAQNEALIERNRNQRTQEQQQQQSAQQREQQEAQQRVDAVNAWEQRVATNDPDYAVKQPLIFDGIKALNADFIAEHRRLPTANEAVVLATTAYQNATKHVAALRPKPAPLPKQPVSQQSQPGAAPRPTSVLEAVRMGLTKR